MVKPVRILLVDDHQIVLDSLAVLFNMSVGIEVVGKVINGHLALDFLEKNKVDLLVTDLNMPDGDGIELCQSCRQRFPKVNMFPYRSVNWKCYA